MATFDWRNTIKINLLVLKFVGLWPRDYEVYKLDGYLIYSVISTILIIGGHNLSQIINIYFVYSDLEALSATVFIAATNIFAVVKRYIFVKNLKVIKELFFTLNTAQFRPRNSDQVELIKFPVTYWRRAYTYFSIIVYLNVTLWSIVPVVNDWVKDRKLPFDAWYPFRTNVSPNYEFTYAYQFICIWYITIANLNLDTLIYAFMMFIATECDILRDNLRNLQYDGNFEKELTACIRHHTEILRFARKSNNFFNLIVLGQIATSTAALALTMFQLSVVDSSGTAFTHLAYLSGMGTEIFLYCWFGNEVEIKSSQIPYAVFESDWIGQSKNAVRNLIILCIKCRKPIKITAINLFTLSLQTFLNILRTAWSYFAVLATINDK